MPGETWSRKVGNRQQVEHQRAQATVAESLGESEAKLLGLYENLRDAYVGWDMDGHIREFNGEFARMLGYEPDEILQLTYQDITPQRWHEAESRILKEQILVRGYSDMYEKEYRKKDGTVFPVELRKILVTGPDREPRGMWSIVRDISERKRAEAALRASEKQYRDLVETAHDLIWAADTQGKITFMNQASRRIYGYEPEELIGRSFLDFLSPEERAPQMEVLRKLFASGERLVLGIETEVLDREGNHHTLVANVVILRDEQGNAVGTMGTSADITERKRAREEIEKSHAQLRALASHLQSVIEEERRRIAREIHDDIGQLLTATKMDLSLLSRSVGEIKEKKIQKTLSKEIEALIGLLDRGVQSIRKIVRDLRPEVLETMGFLAGINWQAKEFEKRTGIRISLSLPPAEPTLEKLHIVAIFRVMQEALTNVARHAEASTVKVELKAEPSALRLTITDNGKGVGEDAHDQPGSFGVIGMRERVAALGGMFSIHGKPCKGTVVEVVLPTALRS